MTQLDSEIIFLFFIFKLNKKYIEPLSNKLVQCIIFVNIFIFSLCLEK